MYVFFINEFVYILQSSVTGVRFPKTPSVEGMGDVTMEIGFKPCSAGSCEKQVNVFASYASMIT